VGTPFEVDYVLDGGAVVALLAAVLTYELAIQNSLPGGLVCDPMPGSDHCDPQTVNAFDRPAIGSHSPPWARASDVAMFTSAIAPVLAVGVEAFLSEADHPALDFLSDLLVIGEAELVATSIFILISTSIRRPRPNQFESVDEPYTFQSQLSFPSGHVVLAAAGAVAYATTFGLRHPDSPWRWVVYSAAAVLPVLTGVGRIADGRHFASDVIAGLVLGGVCGFLVPYLHRREEGSGAQVVLTPVVGPGASVGMGLTVLGW
jgi:membrane-associated phospholipid phosphatase